VGPASVISSGVLNCTSCLCPEGLLRCEEASDNSVNSGAVVMSLLSNWKIAGVTGLGTERLLYGVMGTEAVTVCPGGCRISVRSSYRARGHDKRTHGAHTGVPRDDISTIVRTCSRCN